MCQHPSPPCQQAGCPCHPPKPLPHSLLQPLQGALHSKKASRMPGGQRAQAGAAIAADAAAGNRASLPLTELQPLKMDVVGQRELHPAAAAVQEVLGDPSVCAHLPFGQGLGVLLRFCRLFRIRWAVRQGFCRWGAFCMYWQISVGDCSWEGLLVSIQSTM